jgi:hypothetical protein
MPGVNAFVETARDDFQIAILIQISKGRAGINCFPATVAGAIKGKLRPAGFNGAVMLQDNHSSLGADVVVGGSRADRYLRPAILVDVGDSRRGKDLLAVCAHVKVRSKIDVP